MCGCQKFRFCGYLKISGSGDTHIMLCLEIKRVWGREIERERMIVVQRGEVLDNSRTSDVVSPILLLAFFLYTHTHTTPPQPPPHTHHLHITYYTMTRPHTLTHSQRAHRPLNEEIFGKVRRRRCHHLAFAIS